MAADMAAVTAVPTQGRSASMFLCRQYVTCCYAWKLQRAFPKSTARDDDHTGSGTSVLDPGVGGGGPGHAGPRESHAADITKCRFLKWRYIVRVANKADSPTELAPVRNAAYVKKHIRSPCQVRLSIMGRFSPSIGQNVNLSPLPTAMVRVVWGKEKTTKGYMFVELTRVVPSAWRWDR